MASQISSKETACQNAKLTNGCSSAQNNGHWRITQTVGRYTQHMMQESNVTGEVCNGDIRGNISHSMNNSYLNIKQEPTHNHMLDNDIINLTDEPFEIMEEITDADPASDSALSELQDILLGLAPMMNNPKSGKNELSAKPNIMEKPYLNDSKSSLNKVIINNGKDDLEVKDNIKMEIDADFTGRMNQHPSKYNKPKVPPGQVHAGNEPEYIILDEEDLVIISDSETEDEEKKTNKDATSEYAIHICDFCSDSFCDASLLLSHQWKSVLDEPVECEKCLEIFTHSCALERHKLESECIHRKIREDDDQDETSGIGSEDLHSMATSITSEFYSHFDSDAFEELPESSFEMEKANDNVQTSVIKRRNNKKSRRDECVNSMNKQDTGDNIVPKTEPETEVQHPSPSDGKILDNLIIKLETPMIIDNRAARKSKKPIVKGGKSHKCDVCGTFFGNYAFLKKHRKIHSKKRPFKCELCPSGFNQKVHLQIHMRRHTGEKPYKCQDCGACFTGSSGLKIHRRIHTGEKPYQCDECDAAFNQSGHLKNHKLRHSGEKPFQCDICQAKFTQSGHLKIHLRTHSGEKPYKCKVCDMTFSSSSNLRLHRRTHTGEKPYKCDICGMCFASTGNLSSHRRRHTGEKPFKCDICGSCFASSGNLSTQKDTFRTQTT